MKVTDRVTGICTWNIPQIAKIKTECSQHVTQQVKHSDLDRLCYAEKSRRTLIAGSLPMIIIRAPRPAPFPTDAVKPPRYSIPVFQLMVVIMESVSTYAHAVRYVNLT